jgi:putative phage-type endonuclease
MDRTGFIGGSDISAVMGMNRYTTPLQLWSEKTGKLEPKDLSDNEAVEMGHELEETVARMFTKRTGKKVRRAPKNYTHKEFDYMRCQVDRLVEGTDQLLECKTASLWKEKEWEEEEIPMEYILQVNWQLGITGRTIGHIAVLIGGQKFVYKEIKFDKLVFTSQEVAAGAFWNMIQDKTPPVAMSEDNKFLVELHPKEQSEELQEMQELNDSVALVQQLKATIKDTIDQKNEVEAKLKQVIGYNTGIVTDEYKVTWKAQHSMRLDAKLLKEEQPEIYNRYAVPSETRVLRVRKT